jgi:hypothetical protein
METWLRARIRDCEKSRKKLTVFFDPLEKFEKTTITELNKFANELGAAMKFEETEMVLSKRAV